jgi:uncharacterized membrane protein YhiD involved in acid resistance
MDQFVSPEPLSINALVLNMLLAFVLSVIVAWYYARFGEALSNRIKFAKLLPILTLITVLVISVIKSSLALSLGLVGALSIVRFRTAVKDPEELLYLFFAIAIGLGMGADQRIVTLVAVLVTMLLLAASRLISPRLKRRNLYLNLQVPEGDSNTGSTFESINDLLAKHARFVDMRRLDRHDHVLQLTYFLDCRDQDVLARLMDELRHDVPDCSFSFIDQHNMPGS